MRPDDYAKLLKNLENELRLGARSVAILGLTPITLQLLESLSASGLIDRVAAIYSVSKQPVARCGLAPVRALDALGSARHDVIVVASDEEKEDLLRAAQPFVQGTPKVILAGYGHFGFRDAIFREELEQLFVPSLANGYPHTLAHLFQCLRNAARLRLRGVVAEFGMFKGGTTMFMSRVIQRLSMNWRVIGFDTFAGFPQRRSFLDMYDHPDCVFTDVEAVRRYFSGRDVEIVVGDIVNTCRRLESEQMVLTFLDTDNYSPARAALEVVQERTVIGGAIVFDHFTGVDRFCYTLGERMAGAVLLDDDRYFHLHGTGVFYRQR